MAVDMCIDTGDDALSGCFFVAGGSIYLSGKEQVFDFLRFQRMFELGGIEEVIFYCITGAVRKDEIIEAAEILIKYEGYIGRERIIADKLARLESIKIKGKFDYNSIQSLSTEARQKLVKIDPETIAQASRIPGVSPSDINVLLVLCGR